MGILLLLLLSTLDSDVSETIFVENKNIFTCSIEVKDGEEYLKLFKKIEQLDELAILKPGQSVSHFLIVGSPPKEMKSLMGKDLFSAGTTFEFPLANIEGLQWKFGSMSEKIFNVEGEYEFSISTNLESEDGGYTCKIRYSPS